MLGNEQETRDNQLLPPDESCILLQTAEEDLSEFRMGTPH